MSEPTRRPQKFRRRPIVIEAIQWTGDDFVAIYEWANAQGAVLTRDVMRDTLAIETLEGRMTAVVGDWIIRGVRGEFYPCKPDVFAVLYEYEHEVLEAVAWHPYHA